MNALLSLASVVAPATAVALVAGGVCPPHECSSTAGAAAQPRPALVVASLPMAAPQQQTKVHTHIKVVQQDDTGTYELIIEDGAPRAKINGEAVDADRVHEREDGVWVIESEDGAALATFHISAAPAAPHPTDLGLALQNLPRIGASHGDVTDIYTVTQPKTMFGVVMGPAPDDASGAGILIERVIDGLPAARAGLQKGDIITEIVGVDRATPEALRALLRQKSPGDEVTIRIRRGGEEQDGEEQVGEEKELTVTLDAFDAGKLTQQQPLALAWQGAAGSGEGSLRILSGEAREQMEEAMEALRQAEQFASGEAREAHEQALGAIEQFVAALERMEAEGLSTSEAMRGDLGRWFSQFDDLDMVWGDKPGMVFAIPPNSFQFQNRAGSHQNAPGGNAETGGGQIRKDDVEARLNAMADRLERIEKLLEKLATTAPGDSGSEGSDRKP